MTPLRKRLQASPVITVQGTLTLAPENMQRQDTEYVLVSDDSEEFFLTDNPYAMDMLTLLETRVEVTGSFIIDPWNKKFIQVQDFEESFFTMEEDDLYDDEFVKEDKVDFDDDFDIDRFDYAI